MGLVIRRDVGNKTLYRINERQLREIDDPFLEIPQAELREPLRRFANRITEELSSRWRGEDLRPIFREGIALEESKTLRRVKSDIFGGTVESPQKNSRHAR
jgi:hypothetical protein